MKRKRLEIFSFHIYIYTINEDHMMYGSWNMRCDRQRYLSFWDVFCLFSPLKMRKIKISKLKKIPGYIIILRICTINDNHMMYGSWDMEHDRKNFLLFWTVFCPFISLGSQKNNILKKLKQTWRYYDFTNINNSHIMYGYWDMEHERQNFLSFWTIFYPFTSLQTQKIKIFK